MIITANHYSMLKVCQITMAGWHLYVHIIIACTYIRFSTYTREYCARGQAASRPGPASIKGAGFCATKKKKQTNTRFKERLKT